MEICWLNMYSCPKCAYSVKTKQSFDEHYERVHEGVIVARCPICEKTFNSKRNVGWDWVTWTGTRGHRRQREDAQQRLSGSDPDLDTSSIFPGAGRD